MSEKNTGGQAFPRGMWEYDGQGNILPYQEDGMTLRDYFAAKAIAPLMRTVQKCGKTGPDAEGDDFEWAAVRAYMMADALLKAREA